MYKPTERNAQNSLAMMNYAYDTSLQETMILTEAFHTDRVICDNGSLYKFIWVQEGKLTLIVDHVEIEMEQDEIISVSNLHRTEFKNVSGRYLALLFNENFYGIYKHEKEVSCSGVLFNGTSGIVHLRLPIADSELLHEVVDRMVTEYILRDNLQGEMLRLLLKRFIILCTRLARKQLSGFPVNEKGFDIIQRYYVLVDNHFKEKKQVQAYAALLHRSPKTLSNLFVFQTPLKWSKKEMDFRFPTFPNATVYDSYNENINLYEILGVTSSNTILDLADNKKKYGDKRYLLTTKLLNYKILKSFALEYHPIEMNVIMNNEGEGIYLYDLKQPKQNKFKINTTALISYKYRIHSILSVLHKIGFKAVFTLILKKLIK